MHVSVKQLQDDVLLLEILGQLLRVEFLRASPTVRQTMLRNNITN
jgi:hypothetical protein